MEGRIARRKGFKPIIAGGRDDVANAVAGPGALCGKIDTFVVMELRIWK